MEEPSSRRLNLFTLFRETEFKATNSCAVVCVERSWSCCHFLSRRIQTIGIGNSHSYDGSLQLIQELLALESEAVGNVAGKMEYAETHLRYIAYMIIMIEFLNPAIDLSLCWTPIMACVFVMPLMFSDISKILPLKHSRIPLINYFLPTYWIIISLKLFSITCVNVNLVNLFQRYHVAFFYSTTQNINFLIVNCIYFKPIIML